MKARKTVTNTITHVILAILSFIWVLPIIWVILTSFRKQKGSYVTSFFPKEYTLDNYKKLFTDTSILNFPQMFMNTLIISIFVCIISTLFVLSVAYLHLHFITVPNLILYYTRNRLILHYCFQNSLPRRIVFTIPIYYTLSTQSKLPVFVSKVVEKHVSFDTKWTTWKPSHSMIQNTPLRSQGKTP